MNTFLEDPKKIIKRFARVNGDRVIIRTVACRIFESFLRDVFVGNEFECLKHFVDVADQYLDGKLDKVEILKLKKDLFKRTQDIKKYVKESFIYDRAYNSVIQSVTWLINLMLYDLKHDIVDCFFRVSNHLALVYAYVKASEIVVYEFGEFVNNNKFWMSKHSSEAFAYEKQARIIRKIVENDRNDAIDCVV